MKITPSIILLTALLLPLICVVHPIIQYSSIVTNDSTGVKVLVGPTPIMEGEAKGPNDITLMNEFLAVAFGISTTPPWGITPGHIIDIAPVGERLSDVVAQFSFPLNDWGNWATITDFKVVENTTQRGVIRAVGEWRDLKVEYIYILESGNPYMKVIVNVTNTGTVNYTNYIMGPAITFERGWTFVPGYGTGRVTTRPKEDVGVVEDWVSGYHEDFAIGLYAPNYTHISLHTFFVDPFYRVTLIPGESKIFESYIIVSRRPDICDLVKIVQEFKGGSLAYISGSVANIKGDALPGAAIVAYSIEKPYCWSITNENGLYYMPIPPGSYSLLAVAKAHGPSSWHNVTLRAGDIISLNFTDVTLPGKLVVNVYRNDTMSPVDARIIISGGYVPPVQYMALTTAYTDLYEVGKANVNLAPGNYTISIDYGAGFISLPVNRTVTIESESTVEINVTIEVVFRPSDHGWYTADLHHHSDYLDGKTPPDLLLVAQLASALEFIFVSDHDYVGNCPVIEQHARMRNVSFICGVEISPDWAHFNVYPLLYPEKLIYRGTLREIITSARSAGAIVIKANHPYVGGLFIAQEQNNIPGGYYEDWDLAEINGPWGSDDARTLSKMFTLWDFGLRKYISAGSDVHDVITQTYTGKPRVVAYLPKGPNPYALSYAEKYGRTFITYGPFIFTDPLPGSTVFAKSHEDNITIRMKMFSIHKLYRLEIYVKNGRLLRSLSLNNTMQLDLEVTVPVKDATNGTLNGYVVFIVYDTMGNRAINNPIWIDLAGVPSVITETITNIITETQTIMDTITSVLMTIYFTTEIKEYTITQTITQKETITHYETYTETLTTPTTLTETVPKETKILDVGTIAFVGIICLLIGMLGTYFIRKK